MMTDSKSIKGVGFPEVLLVVFIVLKLIGVIDWSWWWVLAPFWMPLALALLVIVVLKAL
jgi:hypothetical protein